MADECDDVMSGKKSISIDLRKFRDSFYTRKKVDLSKCALRIVKGNLKTI